MKADRWPLVEDYDTGMGDIYLEPGGREGSHRAVSMRGQFSVLVARASYQRGRRLLDSYRSSKEDLRASLQTRSVCKQGLPPSGCQNGREGELHTSGKIKMLRFIL